MNDKLPPGWTTAPLKQLAKINPRHPRGLDDAMPVTFVPMAGLSETKPALQFTEERLLGKVRRGFTHFADADVLFAKITPCMENGKGAVARGLLNKLGCGTTELHVVRPLGGIIPEYIYRFLAQRHVRRAARDNFTGTAGQARVPTTFIEELEVPLAPLAEQRRIVAKLETLLGKVDACRQRLAKIPVLLKRFRQSVLAAACSGRLTEDWREMRTTDDTGKKPSVKSAKSVVENPVLFEAERDEAFPESWHVATLGSLTSLVTSGSRGWAKYYAESGSTFIRAQNINSDFLNLEDIAFVRPPASAEGLRTRIQQHDILVTITGANVTKSALVEQPIDEAYVSQHVALVRLKDIRLSKFVFHSIIGPAHGRKQLLAAAYGQGKPGLNLDNIHDVVVGLPPLAEQQEIVRRVEALFALADRVEARLQRAQAQVDKLTTSILAKAFRGELVPQDPNDEPAEGLLQRIRDGKHARMLVCPMPRTTTSGF
ncbi:MAG TPA: restriction endonuclease subunit S [Verrucomicrobiota bacterium]|nr:restriction endonuclease subunit S [Verrucomicrobiota bacterium]